MQTCKNTEYRYRYCDILKNRYRRPNQKNTEKPISTRTGSTYLGRVYAPFWWSLHNFCLNTDDLFFFLVVVVVVFFSIYTLQLNHNSQCSRLPHWWGLLCTCTLCILDNPALVSTKIQHRPVTNVEALQQHATALLANGLKIEGRRRKTHFIMHHLVSTNNNFAMPPVTVYARSCVRHSLPCWRPARSVTQSEFVFTARVHCSQCRPLQPAEICLSVRPSFLSHSGVLCRRMKIRQCGLHYQVEQSLYFWMESYHIDICRGGHPPSDGVKAKSPTPVASKNVTNNQPYLGNGASWKISQYYLLIGSRICAFVWYQNR